LVKVAIGVEAIEGIEAAARTAIGHGSFLPILLADLRAMTAGTA
jgi:hypothetical protein